MTQVSTRHDRYVEDFRAFQHGPETNGTGWLNDIRQRGLESFNLLGFPTSTRGNERWKYTNLVPIARATFEYPFDFDPEAVNPAEIRNLAPWEEAWTRLVFLDGHYSDALSTARASGNGVYAADLPVAISDNSALVERYLGHQAIADEDGFTAINTAFLRDGAFVHSSEGSSPEAVVHLVFVSTDRTRPTVSHPRALIIADRNSRLTVVESYIGLSDAAYFTNSVVEMVANEGAQIEHYRYLAESPNAFHIANTRVSLKRDSAFSSTSFARGARIARNGLEVLMDAPGSSCVLNGLYYTSGKQHIDNHIDIDHAKPHASSEQYFKGILADESRAVFSGRVLVRKDAQKTYARQSDKNLILSEGARMNTKPSLEIFADDVQCFHGATAGAMADDALFYMRSRGLDEESARALLIYGFASEIIDKVRLEPLRKHLESLFSDSLPVAA